MVIAYRYTKAVQEERVILQLYLRLFWDWLVLIEINLLLIV